MGSSVQARTAALGVVGPVGVATLSALPSFESLWLLSPSCEEREEGERERILTVYTFLHVYKVCTYCAPWMDVTCWCTPFCTNPYSL